MPQTLMHETDAATVKADAQYQELLHAFENKDDLSRRSAAAMSVRQWRCFPPNIQDSCIRLVSGVWRHHLISHKYDRALSFAKTLQTRGAVSQRPAMEAEGYLAEGVAQLSQGNLLESIERLELSTRIFSSIGNMIDVARSSIPHADACRFSGQRDQAFELVNRAKSICLEYHEPHLLGSVMFTLGLLNKESGDLTEAGDWFRYVRKSSELLNSKKRYLHATLSLSNVLCRRGEFIEAKRLAEEALGLAIELNLSRDAALANEYIGDARSCLGETQTALQCYARVRKYLTHVPTDRTLAIGLHAKLATFWVRLRNPHYAGLHVKKADSMTGGSSEDLMILDRARLEVVWLKGEGEYALDRLIAHAEKAHADGFRFEYFLAAKSIANVADGLGKHELAIVWSDRVLELAGLLRASSLLKYWGEQIVGKHSSGSPQHNIKSISSPVRDTHFSSKLAAELPKINLDEFGIITSSRRIQEQGALIARLAPTAVPILIQGESGTGKELFARLVHRLSSRSGPLLAINCGALPGDLLESELFGHRRGAFTGAVSDRPGLFQAASLGTLFLDEIGEMPLVAQVKLLRALESGEIRQVGGTSTRIVDVRIITATNKGLKRAVQENSFRRDLYHRLNGLRILLPPLRERLQDIPLLAEHFLRECNRSLDKSLHLPLETKEWLIGLSWSGNVRELRLAIERASYLAPKSGSLYPYHFVIQDYSAERKSLPRQLEDIERSRIKNALEVSDGVITSAARLLGIGRTTLTSRMKRLGIKRDA